MSEQTTQPTTEDQQSAEIAVKEEEIAVKTQSAPADAPDIHQSTIKEADESMPTKISSGEPPRSQYIRLRGLPFNATEKDIHEFFAGLTIERVKFVCTTGRPNGEAYVEFKNTEEAGKAMENDRKEISNRYIEVFTVEADEAEFEFRPDPDSNGEVNHVIRLRGVPWSCKEDDVRKFFEGLEPPPAEIVIGGTGGPRSRPSGEAFVRFTTQDAAEKAMDYNNRHMGSRYVEVFMSSMVEFNRAKGGGSGEYSASYERTGIRPLMSVDSGYDHGRRGGGGRYGDSSYDRGYDDYNRGSYGGRRDYGYNGGHDQGGRSDYGRGGDDPLRVYMRGLPYDADDHAIAAFFSPLRCHSVKIGINETGRPSGDAIAEFDNYNDLQVALSRNNQRMGRRYVELFDNRGAPGPMRRLLWKETSGTNASAAPAPDPILNGGRRGGGPPQRDSGYRAGPQAMPPSYRESRDPYGPREPRGYDIEPKYEPRGIPPRSAPIRAPPAAHGRAPDTWGSYGAASTGPSYDQSSAAGGYAASWDAYYASQAQSAYSAEPASTYPTAAHSAYGSGESYSYGASAGGAYDRQREPRDSQPTWAQQQQPSHHSAYGGWGAGAGDHRSGY